MQDSLCCHPLLRALALIGLCCAPFVYLVFWGLDIQGGALRETLYWDQAALLLVSLIFPALILPRFERHWLQPGAPWDLPQ